MQKTCTQCSSSFEITDEDLAFYEKISPVFNGKKESIPPPTQCPECRMQRRLTFRNDRSLYHSTSNLSGKATISMYHPDRKYIIYTQQEWWSDAWDPLAFGASFDPSVPFFMQFTALQQRVPRFPLFNVDSENSDYVNYAPHCKNCYLLFGSWFNHDCSYGQTLTECKSSFDNLFLEKSELCYECVDCASNYRTSFCHSCSNCSDSMFCFDCKNVRSSVGCWNLRNKEYYLFNKPATKGEIDTTLAQMHSDRGLRTLRERYGQMIRERAVHQALTGSNNDESSGDFLFECKNVRQCFSAYRCQDMAYSARLMDQKDTWDFEGGGKGELAYESMSNDFAFHSIACTTSEHLTDSHYCDLCFECKDCFGCVGLRHKQCCILNRQYSKEEYDRLIPQIIEKMRADGEWGEFFPVESSPFAYNETMAQEYFFLTKKEVLKRGWKWRDQTDEMPTGSKIIPAMQLPDSIDDIPDDILNWAVECEETKRPFKIIKQELEFYRLMKLPIPHFHPDERHKRRMAQRNPRKLWQRKCHKCGKEMQTTYGPERPERVYCEECYLKEVY